MYPAIYFVAALVVSASSSCVRQVTCPCGTSGNTYTFCTDGLVIQGDPCDRWTECETCREGYPYCASCPPDRIGGLCITVSVRKSRRKKRQNNPLRRSDLERRSQSSSGQSRNSVTCSHPGIDANAEVVDSLLNERRETFVVGSSLQYKCKKEYILRGEAKIHCLRSGLWSSDPPTCDLRRPINTVYKESEIECVPQEDVLHSRVYRRPNADLSSRVGSQGSSVAENPVGTVLEYSCEEGYVMKGNDYVVCKSNGFWSTGPPECVKARSSSQSLIECVPLDTVLHARVYRKKEGLAGRVAVVDTSEVDLSAGTELQYECEEGYVLNSNRKVVCQPNGFWSAEPPECVAVSSRDGVPPDIECVPQEPIYNGRVYSTVSAYRSPVEITEQNSEDLSNPVGTQLQYLCDVGYTLVGQEYIICEPTGFWSAEPPACVKESPSDSVVECVPLDLIDHGKVYRIVDPREPPELITEDSVDMEFPVGTLLQYSCDVGYILNGAKDLFCEPNGFWTAESPTCVEDCGYSVVEPSPKVTNGNATRAGEWPWMVSISVLTRNNFSNLICGGALLDKRTVLTAAHCFTKNSPPYILHFGKYYRRNSQNDDFVVSRRVNRVISHPNFNPTSFANDIALIKLDSDLEYSERILPICLPTPVSSVNNLVPTNKGIVTGWGINENSLRSDALMMANIPVQSPQICMSAFREQGLPFRMLPGMFCAGYPEGIVSACKGDSGSPFVFYNYRTHRYTTEGCVSFSVEGQCGRAGIYTVFTKISNYLPWIDQTRRRRRT